MENTVKKHLGVINGGGEQTQAAPKETAAAHTRIRLGTIFIDQSRRQAYIRDEIANFWLHSEAAIQQLLKINAEVADEDSMLPVIQNVRRAFLINHQLAPHPQLEELLDKVAILALHCLKQLRKATRDIKTAEYDSAFTSTDFYQYDPISGKKLLKNPKKLSVTISNKDFDLDTSTFEKDVAKASIAVIHYRLRLVAPNQPDTLFDRYLLSIFTAFNQRKHL